MRLAKKGRYVVRKFQTGIAARLEELVLERYEMKLLGKIKTALVGMCFLVIDGQQVADWLARLGKKIPRTPYLVIAHLSLSFL